MIKLTDGKMTAEITMVIWQETGYSPCIANDYYDVGCLEYVEESNAYKVDDVSYCIETAQEWEQEAEENTVFVDVLEG